MPSFLKSYYGGRTLPHVAGVVRDLDANGMKACVSLLPRFHLRPQGIDSEKAKYLAILPFLETQGLSADLTVKLSQFGQRWRFADCVKALDEVASHCAEHRAFLWVDMEQSSLVDMTLEAFEHTARTHRNVGICLQTYLRRTAADLEALLVNGHPVRLVKGYYRERPPACFETWKETTQNLARLLPALLEKSRRPAIGTHDPWLIEQARQAVAKARVLEPAGAGGAAPVSPLEFQFFLGARPELPAALTREGRSVRVYIPYGALLPYILHSLPFMDLSRNLQRVLGFQTVR